MVGGNYRKPVQATQPGWRIPSGATTGGRPIIERINFLGQGGDMRANSPAAWNSFPGCGCEWPRMRL